jgi:hypothetical protein
MNNRRLGMVSACAVAAAAVTGGLLYAGTGQPATAQPFASREGLFAALNAHAAASMWRPQRLTDMLPNVRHAWRTAPSEQGQPVSDSVVRGRIVDVEAHAGFIESGRAPTAGRPGASSTAYDDPAAHWRAVRVTIAVAETLAGSRTEQIEVYLSMIGHAERAGEVQAMEQTLEDLGEVVVITQRHPNAPEYLGLRRSLVDTSFGILTVDGSGRLGLPFADQEEGTDSAAFLEGVDTLDELRAESSKAPQRRTHDG